jgi:hypothetical protein
MNPMSPGARSSPGSSGPALSDWTRYMKDSSVRAPRITRGQVDGISTP